MIDLVVAPWVRGSDSGLFFLEMMALPGVGVVALAVRAPAKIRRVIAAHGGIAILRNIGIVRDGETVRPTTTSEPGSTHGNVSPFARQRSSTGCQGQWHWETALQSLIALVSGIGFLVCLYGHVALRVGHDPFGEAWFFIFAGVFVVWLPTVFTLGKFGAAMQKRGGWKVVLIGAPAWARYVVGAAFVYAIVNFALYIIISLGITVGEESFWNIGSSHAMAFYAMAWATALAAANREKLGIEWKCERGHDLTPGARFCEECGAPAARYPRADI